MKKILKLLSIVFLFIISFSCVACEKNKVSQNEKISLAKTVLGEVEFENSDKVELEQNEDLWIVSGEIESMTAAQKSAFGLDGVTHVVVLKYEFDDERTIDYFKIKGDVTKVYSTDKTVQGYVGSITELLDNESGEDAFCYLVLSANTKEYEFTAKYTDGVESVFKMKIEATLSSAKAE